MSEAVLRHVLARIKPLDESAMLAACRRQDQLTKPRGALGRLEELSIWLAGVRGDPMPRIDRRVIITAAADHGVARRGVSAYPPEVTVQMVLNFLQGRAAVNVLARLAHTEIVVVDAGVAGDLPNHPLLRRMAVRRGTDDISAGPAMTRVEAVACLLAGIGLAQEQAALDVDVLGIGDMGIGNTTPSAAITSAFTGLSPAAVTGRGTGVGDERLGQKVALVAGALAINRPDPTDAIDVLAKVGGFEIGVLAGVCLGAAVARLPVVLDGFIATAAALVAAALAPEARYYILAAHRSAEPGHTAALAHLELSPLIEFGMRLGEGTGAALGIIHLEAAARILSEMATFDEAGVSTSDETTVDES